MRPTNLPDDINAEILLNHYPEGSVKVVLKGLHKRNSYMDIADIEEGKNGDMHLSLGRCSIYNSLPEYLFHPIDRFDNLPANEYKERFDEECARQEQERESALAFFAPIDLYLLRLRLDIRKRTDEYLPDNRILQDILGDSLTEEQRRNRFIRRAMPFLPSCRYMRGNRTLITFMLRKIFADEGIGIEKRNDLRTIEDERPRYGESTGDPLGSLYIGAGFQERITTYTVRYWPENECDENFLHFIDEAEVFRQFVQDYFISIEETIEFDFQKDGPALRLSDTSEYNYLNYNTNI